MFNFLCKYSILHHHGRTRHPTLCFLQNSSSSIAIAGFISSTTENPNQNSFAASYLITKFGFSPQSAQSAARPLKFKTLNKPDSVIHAFKRYGFTEDQIFKIIKKYPRLLACKPEKSLLPKLEFFHSKGVSGPDIAHIWFVWPSLFHRSLEKRITPTFNFLSDLLQSNCKAVLVVKRCALILNNDCERDLKPRINALRESGMNKQHIASLVQNWPRCVALCSPSQIRGITNRLRGMGFDPSKSQFAKAVVIMLQLSKSRWERKIDVCKSWGWSEEEILTAFQKQPFFMAVSENKIKAVVEFFVKEMNCKSSFVAKHPTLITLSLEKRLIPRASVIQFLLSNKLIDEKPSLLTLFMCSDESFLKRFVKCFDEAPQLLKLYRDASNKSFKMACNS